MNTNRFGGSFRAKAGTVIGMSFATVVLMSGTANADTFVPLPDGHVHFTGHDGVTMYVDRTHEHATVSSSMASSPTSRNVWVSGVAATHVDVPANVAVTGGTIETGYLLGCQVDISSGLSVGTGDAGGYGALNQGATPGLSPYTDPNLSLTLAPGKVVSVKVNSYDFTGNSGTAEYDDRTLAIEGCAGAAQARSYTTVTTHDNIMDDTETLWGQPFSIG